MPKFAIVLTAALLVAATSSTWAQELKSEDDKVLYAIGLALSRSLVPFNLNESEVKTVEQGLTDGSLSREPKVDFSKYAQKIQEFVQKRTEAAAAVEKKKGESYIADAAKEKGAEKLDNGAIYIPVKEGTGASPQASDRVKVDYVGKLIDGTVFDSTKERGQPAVFPLNGVISCWTQGVAKMKVGGEAKLVCPSDTAYGDRGSPPKIKPGSTLVFDVQLREIVSAPTPGPAPKKMEMKPQKQEEKKK